MIEGEPSLKRRLEGDKTPALVAAEARADAIGKRFFQSPGVIFDELGVEIEGARLADRYDPARTLEQFADDGHTIENPLRRQAVEEGGEVGLKRAQMKTELDHLRTLYGELADRLKSLVVDLEASKQDY